MGNGHCLPIGIVYLLGFNGDGRGPGLQGLKLQRKAEGRLAGCLRIPNHTDIPRPAVGAGPAQEFQGLGIVFQHHICLIESRAIRRGDLHGDRYLISH